METTQEDFQLKIPLNADEAEEFLRLVMSDKPDLQAAIAKSLLFGSKRAVDPGVVRTTSSLVCRMSEFGLRGDLPVSQEDATALSYSCDQLQLQVVKDAICTWAFTYRLDIRALDSHQSTPDTDQRQWMILEALSSGILNALGVLIASQLQEEQAHLMD